MWRVVDYFEHGLGEITLPRGLDRAVTEDEGHAEASIARREMHDGSFLEFQAKGPAVFWRNALPLLESDALFLGQPIHATASKFQRWDREP